MKNRNILLITIFTIIMIMSLPLLSGCSEKTANAQSDGSQSLNQDNISNIQYSLRYDNLNKFDELPLKDIIEQGSVIDFQVSAENEDWQRPVYTKVWDNGLYKEKFPNPYALIEAAQHSLFEIPAGASTSFPFYVNLGFEQVIEGAQPSSGYLALLMINFKAERLAVMDNQMAIVGETARSGYQVIWINREDLPQDKLLISLSTKDGDEIDYLPLIF